MAELTQIFSNDPVVPYKTTQVNPLTTKAEIEGLLARWNIKKYAWEWDPDNGKIDGKKFAPTANDVMNVFAKWLVEQFGEPK